ncbi:cysteine desulfurase [Arthrobacter agilis]|uniref:cysteine desulfurase family protein n=1 Tax=Arthrobacter agilis TaxID=37921 RepID=UPI000B35C94C|nr:cysteine desulfurase family protein [Arthrobacter agilis]OUM44132.1 cysteine desulfurase [Arthrobacter agilis]PPB46508.1 cysteine desulfurase [Arthrobacter agilis]TPV23836.1 cysteine desulfurase [Arthrobacter agilis]VDR32572.1 Cysteine desulfurase [Arthrobacter agilis]
MIYLDAAATAPVRREVLEEMWPILTSTFGNPSSHHAIGEAAARAFEDARRRIASLLGCRPGEIIFTSGGTEANNLALKGMALARPRGRHIVTSTIEHPAVTEVLAYLREFHGFRITAVPVTPAGVVTPEAVAAVLERDTTLCTVMYANNEVGTVQDVAALAEVCRRSGVPFHTDAVQAAGWCSLDVDRLGLTALSISGHKLGTPKGIGALYLRAGTPCEAVLHGGGQERGRRSGTENVAGAVGLARALELARAALPEAADEAGRGWDALAAGVLDGLPEAVVTGHTGQSGHSGTRLPNLMSFCFPGVSGEAVLLELERRGIVCSSGSACAAGSSEPSAVLLALGLDAETALSAVRLSWTRDVRSGDLAAVADAVVSSVRAVRGLGVAPRGTTLTDA